MFFGRKCITCSKDKNKRLSDAFVTTGLVLKKSKRKSSPLKMQHHCTTNLKITQISRFSKKYFFNQSRFFYLITSHFCDDFEITFSSIEPESFLPYQIAWDHLKVKSQFHT